MAYKDILKTAESTSGTLKRVNSDVNAGTILNLWLTIIVLIASTLLVLWGGSKYLNWKIGGLWDKIKSPWTNRITKLKELENVQDIIEKTGQSSNITTDEAKELADRLYSCFSPWGDNETGIYNCLKSPILKNNTDWGNVVSQFGARVNQRLLNQNSMGLNEMLADKLTTEELATCRSILRGKGITPTF